MPNLPSTIGEPTWEMATDWPEQGGWNESEYLRLPTNRFVEFCDGVLEFPPMPTLLHQEIVGFLYALLLAYFNAKRIGKPIVAPYRVRLRPGKYREPDIVVSLFNSGRVLGQQSADGADLVVEVVSPDDPDRDWVTKKAEYAQAGIPEYWIVDPRTNTITVFGLDSAKACEYATLQEAAVGQTAVSRLLDGLNIDVAAVFAAAGETR